jgi:hypothetical protein
MGKKLAAKYAKNWPPNMTNIGRQIGRKSVAQWANSFQFFNQTLATNSFILKLNFSYQVSNSLIKLQPPSFPLFN